MRILVETSGGGGVVLLVAVALLASHGGGISVALAAVVIALMVAVVLAVAGLGAYLVYRARRPGAQGYAPAHRATLRAEVVQPEPHAALAPPQVRLDADQLAELAEIIRRSQRPEH